MCHRGRRLGQRSANGINNLTKANMKVWGHNFLPEYASGILIPILRGRAARSNFYVRSRKKYRAVDDNIRCGHSLRRREMSETPCKSGDMAYMTHCTTISGVSDNSFQFQCLVVLLQRRCKEERSWFLVIVSVLKLKPYLCS